MTRKDEPLQNAFQLGELLPIRIHDYITNLLIHRRNENDRGKLDVLEQWSLDIESYMNKQDIERTEQLIITARKQQDNGYTNTNNHHTTLRAIERILHRSSDRAGLKAANQEAQQIIDYEAELAEFNQSMST